jgi:hypothetical protein
MITERAIIFDKIKLRYARNVVLYGLPESPDTFTDALCEITNSDNWKIILKLRLNLAKMKKVDKKEYNENSVIEEAKAMMKENHADRSVVGLFSKFDKL